MTFNMYLMTQRNRTGHYLLYGTFRLLLVWPIGAPGQTSRMDPKICVQRLTLLEPTDAPDQWRSRVGPKVCVLTAHISRTNGCPGQRSKVGPEIWVLTAHTSKTSVRQFPEDEWIHKLNKWQGKGNCKHSRNILTLFS